MLVNLPCPMGHRIQILAQKDWFYPEILGQEVGPISVRVEQKVSKWFNIKAMLLKLSYFEKV